MTKTGEPLLDRLEQELMDVEAEFDGGTDEQIAPIWMRYGPELHALVLQYRDMAKHYENVAQKYVHRNDALVEALKAIEERSVDQQMAYTCVECGCEAICHQEDLEDGRGCERCQRCRVPVTFVITRAALKDQEGRDAAERVNSWDTSDASTRGEPS